ncbi:nicotinate-nucleotide--dimethylbenzimidazole phosphoribosyltransferase [Berryella wangjianweii]|uniref:Nicotinate-nucleotide--dimethylbenzimidazole phosphoribosyltransferase n=1 Tax=Berryella wangjianweii TaxID=2734634 RepID=A0A6M8J5X3_9ACTN|nr:nicotinate-nucleotide--dimethylbenzimidazole phosphoribosyltransferase [Berryella wangjianweii]QKF06869.1 nicotinate-nucleotide--dimethylbenzimidazole phosphoribosyltransferase [Berryella wangjianweii]
MSLAALNQPIPAPSEQARAAAHARWNAVAKPLGSLGALEAALERIAALTHRADISLQPRALLVACADNGVVSEGVSQSDHRVTTTIARALGAGTSSACALARVAGARVVPVNVGMADATPAGVLDRCVRRGTGNIAREDAMTHDQAVSAIEAGIACARALADEGTALLCLGEMGIGNTTTATALACRMLGLAPDDAAGRGAGLSDEGLQRKRAVLRRVIDRCVAAEARALAGQDEQTRERLGEPPHERARECAAALAGAPAASDSPPRLDRDARARDARALGALTLLRTAGGLDIAFLAGAVIGAAQRQLPVVVDGIVSQVAALIAVRLAPACAPAVLASHLSDEPASAAAAARLARETGSMPIIDAGMRLGEGTGALCLLPLLDMAHALYTGATFADHGLQPYRELAR